MSGIVLLDEEQQRVLYASPPQTTAALYNQQQHQAPSARRASLPRSTTSSNGADVATNQGLPRTNYLTSTSIYNNVMQTGNTINGMGKPSTSDTFNSSPRTDFSHRSDALRHLSGHSHQANNNTSDLRSGLEDHSSYPMLRDDDDDRSSAGDSAHGGATAAHRYAGTSSGLKISVGYILTGVVVGTVLGVTLSVLHVPTDVARWVNLPGDLFLRALKCIVVPYAFCAVAVAIGDIVFVGKVSVVGVQTLRMFALLWVSSTAIGLGVALSFRPLFRIGRLSSDAPRNAIGFTCRNGALLVVDALTNNVACAARATSNGTALPAAATFVVTDVHDVFAKSASSGPRGLTQLALTDQLIASLSPVVSGNITASLANGDLLSIITFAMVLGAIAGRNYFTHTRRVNYLYLLLLQLRNTFFLAMEWIIWLSPVAVVSIIAGSFATNQDALRQFGSVYVYVLAALLAAVLHMLVVLPLIVFLLTRCNPYNHMKQMLRAYMFAFACQSSLATAPVTLTCVKKAKVCSQSLGNFVISIGVCSNLSAVGWYIPIATIFIAESSGNGDQITFLRLIGIFVLSVLQCAATAPIPSGVLVSMVTIYTTLFGVSAVPDTFAYVVAMDFLVDRFVTVCNVNDDIMCLKVIAENTDETVTQEQLGERD